MAGYWPYYKFFSSRSRSINTLKKKRTRPIPSHLDRTSLKDLLYGIRHQKVRNFSCGTKRAIPSGQDRSILPAHRATHIIMIIITLLSPKQSIFMFSFQMNPIRMSSKQVIRQINREKNACLDFTPNSHNCHNSIL